MDFSLYHLTQNPFLNPPAPGFLFVSPSHKAALQTIIDGIEQRQGFVAIVGETGLGKTALLHAYLASIDQQQVKTISISGTSLSLRDMLLLLCQTFGLDGAIDDLTRLSDRLRRFLIEAHKQGQNIVLIIDDAHNLPVQTLWNLRMLSDLMETDAGRLVQIVLVGRNEFEQKCDLPELRQFAQLLVMRSTLSPLTPKESIAYIQHRLAQVALHADPVFTPRALIRIVKRAKGVPRALNLLGNEVLIAGVMSQEKPISAKIAQEVLANWEGKRASPRLRWGVACAAGLLLLAGVVGISTYETLMLPSIRHLQSKYFHTEKIETRAVPFSVQAKDALEPSRATSPQPLADASNTVNTSDALHAWETYRAEGEKAYEQGRYAEAEGLLVAALQGGDGRSARDPRLATRLTTLVTAYRDQGQYAQTEQLLLRTLAIREKALGPETSFIVMDLNSLAGLYHDQGKYTQAEPLYQQVLAIDQKLLGGEHPYVATSLNNLAVLYETQGRYAEAEPLYQRALAIKERTLGAEHPSVATSLSNLAVLYRAQGRYAEAEPLYQRALAIKERTLGVEHPSVATSLSNLAVLYRAQGRYAEAESLYQRALAIRERTQGVEHPSVATSLSNLAVLYHTQGRYAEAEPLYQRALAIDQKHLGLEHPSVALDLENYAALLRKTDRHAQAAKLEARAKEIRVRRTP